MRKVAAKLGVTAMALYHHVADKNALINLVADEVMNIVPDMEAHQKPWHDELRRGFLAVHQAIVRYPGLGLYIASSNGFYPSGFRKFKETVQLLLHAGFDEREAIEVNYLLLAYQGGYVLMEQSAEQPAVMTLDAERDGPLANIRSRSEMNSYDAYVRGLDIIIAGFRVQLSEKQGSGTEKLSA